MFLVPQIFLFYWVALLSISLLASVFPVSLALFFFFLWHCLIHARMRMNAFVARHICIRGVFADVIDSRPDAWSYVLVQSSSCSPSVSLNLLSS